jgi:hypothetical protein
MGPVLLITFRTLASAVLGMTVLLWRGTAFSADRVEYEGRLTTNVPGPRMAE